MRLQLRKMKCLKKKYIIGGIIILLALGYLSYIVFSSSVTYYVTVSEFKARGTELYNTDVRVSGEIADNTIDWNAEDIELRFTIAEGDETMKVIYQGVQPSGFKPGSNILVEGKYHSDDILWASQLIMKCPSKYEPEE